jgi:hypothetical protein
VSTLTPAQVYSLARDAGLDSATAVIAMAIAVSESGLRTDATGDVGLQNATWGPSVGLWQIRSLKAESGTGSPRDATRLTEPAFNAASMASISGAGKSFTPWSTYTSGAYRKNLVTMPNGTTPTTNWLENTWGAVTGAVGGAVAAVNPFAGWEPKALGLLYKGTFIAGAVRLVMPGLATGTAKAMEALS